eukprot:PhF_6_TR30594/c0_g1_i1/m.45025
MCSKFGTCVVFLVLTTFHMVPASGQWVHVPATTTSAQHPFPSVSGHCAVSFGSYVVVLGSLTSAHPWLVDLTATDSPKWSKMKLTKSKGSANLEIIPRKHMTCVKVGDEIYMFGGITAAGALTQELWKISISKKHNEALFHLLSGGGGKTISTLPPARYRHAATFHDERQELYIHGGYGSSQVTLSDFWVYNVKKSSWTERHTGSTPPGRFGHTILQYKHYILSIGGYTQRRTVTNEMHVLDLGTNGWKEVTHVNPPRSPSGLSAAVRIGDAIYVLTGDNDLHGMQWDIDRGVKGISEFVELFADVKPDMSGAVPVVIRNEIILLVGGKAHPSSSKKAITTTTEESHQTTQNMWMYITGGNSLTRSQQPHDPVAAPEALETKKSATPLSSAKQRKALEKKRGKTDDDDGGTWDLGAPLFAIYSTR